jgi:hypothetical protein
MTALTPAQIPATASASLEKVALWAFLGLSRINGNLKIAEDGTEYVQAVQVTLYVNTLGEPVITVRGTFKLDPSYSSDTTTKLWAKTLELSNAAMPSTFTS